MSTPYRPPRLLIIPGLNDSDSGHWQTWLQAQFPGSRRVVQHRPQVGELERWSARIQDVLDQHPETDWVAAAHSFGVLALAHHLAQVQQRGERSRVGVRGETADQVVRRPPVFLQRARGRAHGCRNLSAWRLPGNECPATRR